MDDDCFISCTRARYPFLRFHSVLVLGRESLIREKKKRERKLIYIYIYKIVFAF